MVSILKDIPIEGVKIVPCRVNGPRGIVKSFLVAGNERLGRPYTRDAGGDS